jgi:hypothetical protein
MTSALRSMKMEIFQSWSVDLSCEPDSGATASSYGQNTGASRADRGYLLSITLWAL